MPAQPSLVAQKSDKGGTCNPQLLQQHFDTLAETPAAPAKLRDLVLEMAIQGRLSAQNPDDEPVSQLVARIKLKSEATDDPRAKKTRDAVDDEQPQGFWYPLPEGWAVLPLGIVTNIVRGITFPSSAKGSVREPNTIACLRTTNVQAEIEWDDILFIPEEFVSRDDQWLKPDDLVISMANSAALVGKIAHARRIPEKATFGGFLAVIRPIELDPSYLLFFLRSPSMQAAFRATSSQTTNIANISLGGMRPLPVAIPPLPEQRRIVAKVEELLALCDELEARQTAAREHRTRLVRSALDHLAAAKDGADFKKHSAFCLQHSELLFDSVPALRQAILSLAVQGRLVPHAEQRDHNIECKGAGEVFSIPGAWQWVTFQALTKAAFTGLERSKAEQSPNREYAYMKMNNITPVGDCDLTEVIRVDATADEVAKYQLKLGDFLFNTRNSFELVGKTCVFQPNQKDVFLFNNNMLKVTFVGGVDQQFINLWCCSPPGRGELTKLKSATTNVAAIYQGKLATLPVPLPPLAEQQRIVAKVDELMRWCDALEALLADAQTTATHLLDATIHEILTAR